MLNVLDTVIKLLLILLLLLLLLLLYKENSNCKSWNQKFYLEVCALTEIHHILSLLISQSENQVIKILQIFSYFSICYNKSLKSIGINKTSLSTPYTRFSGICSLSVFSKVKNFME